MRRDHMKYDQINVDLKEFVGGTMYCRNNKRMKNELVRVYRGVIAKG